MAAMAKQALIHGITDGGPALDGKGQVLTAEEENKNEVEFPDKQNTQVSNQSEVQRTEEDLDEDSTNQMMLTDEEEQQFQIYYDKEQIQASFELQQQDQFEEIMKMKLAVVDPERNGINIMDFLPN